MTTPSSRALADAFGDLRDAGFTKRRMVWCRRSEQTLFSFGLQRSQFADRYYVNVGVWLLGLGEAVHLAPHRCHAYGRFGGGEVEAALDFEATARAERDPVLLALKARDLLPLAARCGTVNGAAGVLRSHALSAPIVRAEARAALGLDP